MTARVQAQCAPSCARYRSPFHPANTTGVIACEAFPAGIPDKIWNNELDHRQPVDGDHGLQWTAAPGYSFPVYALNPGASSGTDTLVAAAGPHTGAMIALIPADPEALEVPGGEPADQLHCTLLFLGEAADISPEDRAAIVADATVLAERTGEITAQGFGLAAFNPTGDEPCVVLLLSGPDLADLHDTVAETIEPDVEQHRPFCAHVTLAYTDDLPMISDLLDLIGPVVFDRIRVAFGDDVTDIPLTGTADEAEPEEDEESDLDSDEETPAETVTAATAEREPWHGCPRCFAPVHEGSCPTGL